MKRAVAILLIAASVTGCTAEPHYHLPDSAMANAPAATGRFFGGADPAFAQAPLPDHWWRLYDDPRLDGFITEALAANTNLRAADANLRRATYVVREAAAGRLPTMGLSGSAGLVRPQGVPEPPPGSAVYELGGSIVYPLDLAGGIRRGVEAAQDNAEAAQAARDQVRVAVAAAVARSYAAACSANHTLAAQQHVVDIQRRTLDVTQRLAKGGRGTAFDVTRAQAAVDQSAAALPAIIAGRQASLFELAALMGRAPADYPKDVETCQAPPALKALLPIGDGSAPIKRRPDIRAAERNLASATATIGVETAQLYPQVSLGGSAGLGGPISGIGNGSQFSFSLGPLLSWRFPNRAVAHARIAEAGASAEAASANFDGVVISALQQTETALTAYARELDRNRDLRRAREDAARAADQANRLFRFGRTGFLDILTSQSVLANAEATLAASDASVVDRQVAVFLALGGGWEADRMAASSLVTGGHHEPTGG